MIGSDEWLDAGMPPMAGSTCPPTSEPRNPCLHPPEPDAASGEFHLLGPPGTGKTTQLAEVWIPRAIDRFGPSAVAVVSLTRAAAFEVAGRGTELPRRRIGTLHSMGRAALSADGIPLELAQTPDGIKAWNEDRAAFGAEALELSNDGSAVADGLLEQTGLLRGLLTPVDDWPEPVRRFWAAWVMWKRAVQRLDFADLVEKPVEFDAPPPTLDGIGVECLICDEVQDMCRLDMRLVRHWGASVSVLVLAGDPNQCQPAGTLVSMQGGGVKPIEEIEVGDHVVSYFTGKSEFRGLRSQGRRVEETAVRPFMGSMRTLHVGNRSTMCTPEHRVLTRSVKRRYWCLYLMQRGENARVGIAQSRYAHGYGLVVRARSEDADCAWILDCFDSEHDARFAEVWTHARFGLPGQVFVDNGQQKQWPQSRLDALHASLDTDEGMRACLRHYGRSARFPIWLRGQREHTVSVKSFVTQACNVVSGFFEMRSFDAWHSARVEIHSPACEPVYSLKVEPTERGKRLYVADGIVVHNSIYAFRGADPRAFHDPDTFPSDRTRVRDHSYRLPPQVHAFAQRIVQRASDYVPIDYSPRDVTPAEESACGVEFLEYATRGPTASPRALINRIEIELERLDEEGATGDHLRVMVLATSGHMLTGVAAALRKAGIRFGNPLSPESAFNPMRTAHKKIAACLFPLRPDLNSDPEDAASTEPRMWTWRELHEFAQHFRAKGLLRHGGKKIIKDSAASTRADEQIDASDIARVFVDRRFIDELRDRAASGNVCRMIELLEDFTLPAFAKTLEYPWRIAKRDQAQLFAEPRVIVGTVHSVKGGTAGTVFVSPEIAQASSAACRRETHPGVANEVDVLCRVFYVAVTRASRRVFVFAPPKHPGRRSRGQIPWINLRRFA